MEVHWKMRFLGVGGSVGGGVTENQYIGGTT